MSFSFPVFFKKLKNGEMDISVLLLVVLRNMLYSFYISACVFIEQNPDNFHKLNNALPVRNFIYSPN